jgi:hypothetical protein
MTSLGFGGEAGHMMRFFTKLVPQGRKEICVKERCRLQKQEVLLEKRQSAMIHAPDGRKSKHAQRVQEAEIELKRRAYDFKVCVGGLNSWDEQLYNRDPETQFQWTEDDLAFMKNTEIKV